MPYPCALPAYVLAVCICVLCIYVHVRGSMRPAYPCDYPCDDPCDDPYDYDFDYDCDFATVTLRPRPLLRLGQPPTSSDDILFHPLFGPASH